jgi:hypothetical protein
LASFYRKLLGHLMTTHIVQRTTPVHAEDRGSLRSYISQWLSLRNTSKNISPERAIDAFRDGLIRRDFREELGQCKPKTIDHLMSRRRGFHRKSQESSPLARPRHRSKRPTPLRATTSVTKRATMPLWRFGHNRHGSSRLHKQ